MRRRRQQNHAYFLESATFHHPVENAELAEAIFQEVNRLPPSFRRSFTLMYMEGKSHKEIAAAQNISVQTVKNNISAALKLLRKRLKHLL